MVNDNVVTLLTKDIEVPVLIKKKIPKLPLGMLIDLSGVKEGATLNLPLRIAEVLVEKGYAEIDTKRLFSVSEINKIRWKEEKTTDLQPLEEGFYVKVKCLLKKINEELMKSEETDVKLVKLSRTVKGIVVDIIKRRIYKIVNLALANPYPSRNLMKLMTKEEKYFYVKTCDVLREWEETLIKHVEGGY